MLLELLSMWSWYSFGVGFEINNYREDNVLAIRVHILFLQVAIVASFLAGDDKE
jgi:hypothetical protein